MKGQDTTGSAIAKQLVGWQTCDVYIEKHETLIKKILALLCDLEIQCNYAKSFANIKTRILAKVAAITTLQFIKQSLFISSPLG